MAKFRQRCM